MPGGCFAELLISIHLLNTFFVTNFNHWEIIISVLLQSFLLNTIGGQNGRSNRRQVCLTVEICGVMDYNYSVCCIRGAGFTMAQKSVRYII